MDPAHDLNSPAIRDFCLQNRIRRLSLFGSYLSGTAQPHSDLDLLVEFDEEFTPSLLDIARMENELSTILQGVKIDLRTAEDLSQYFRENVIKSARVQYGRA